MVDNSIACKGSLVQIKVMQIVVRRINILQFVSRGRPGIIMTKLDEIKYIKMN